MKVNLHLRQLLVLSLNNMRFVSKIILIFFFANTQVNAADNVTDWLKLEIDSIIDVYKDDNMSPASRFQYIENTINQNFAGAGIAKFVAGKAWATADKETKKIYIQLFKRHLALNIAAMMTFFIKDLLQKLNIPNI